MKSPIETLQAALTEKFGNGGRLVCGRVYVTVASFNGETYNHASTQVLLGRTTYTETLDTIRGFGNY